MLLGAASLAAGCFAWKGETARAPSGGVSMPSVGVVVSGEDPKLAALEA